MVEDYYALLGVDPDAPEEAILQAYREQAAEHHPDVSDAADAGETFRQLNRAKAVLTDDERRRAYDRLGHDRFVEREGVGDGGERGEPDRRESPGPADVPRGSPRWPDGLGSMVEGFLGGGLGSAAAPSSSPPGAARAEPGSPFEVNLESLFERAGWSGPAASGATGDDTGRRACPTCGGRGTFIHVLDTARGRRRRREACERCDGTGRVPG